MTAISARMHFAGAVKSRRDQLGLSQEKLAELADLHRTYISDVERGTRNLSIDSISKLARALSISISALFAGNILEPVDAGAPRALHPIELVDVLLVEHDPSDEKMVLQAFARARFANRVHVSRDGQDALDYLFFRGAQAGRPRLERPQVILLELNLPDLGGIEVLRRIKADKRTRDIPVVVLAASGRERDMAECLRLGASSCLAKPLDFQGLSVVAPELNLNWALVRSTTPSPVA